MFRFSFVLELEKVSTNERPALDVQWFRGGLVFKAHRLLHHSTLGSRVKTKKKKKSTCSSGEEAFSSERSPEARLSSRCVKSHCTPYTWRFRVSG